MNRSKKTRTYVLLIAILAGIGMMGCAVAGVDTTAPTVSSTVPADSATAVAVTSNVTASFSEAMDSATITATTFTLKQGSIAVGGVVTYSGTTATFNPSISLAGATVYTATVTTGAKDEAGNALAANEVWTFTTAGTAPLGPAAVNLGTAGNYVILAKSAISTVPASDITGDIGLSPTATSGITGFSEAMDSGGAFATSTQVTGKIYAADMAVPTPATLITAVSDMEAAYTDGAGRVSPDFSELGTGAIGGLTLAPGLYKWTSTVSIPADITISGAANDVWIFQISGDLTVAGAVNVTLSGGAMAKNIFWVVAGAVTVGTSSHFEGILLSSTGITLGTSASMNGRALAQTAVGLDQNTLVEPAL